MSTPAMSPEQNVGAPLALQHAEQHTAAYTAAARHFAALTKDPSVVDAKGRLTTAISQISMQPESVSVQTATIRGIVEGMQADPARAGFVNVLFTRRVLNAAETQITGHPESAVAIGQAVAAVLAMVPALVPVFLGGLGSITPWATPRVPRKLQGEAPLDTMVRRGYRRVDGGLEPEDSYSARALAYVRLLAGIVSSRPFVLAGAQPSPNPIGVEHGWVWLARMVNLSSSKTQFRPFKAGFDLIAGFLGIAGHALCSAYPERMRALMALLANDYIAAGLAVTKNVRPPGLSRLQLLVEEYQKAGSIPPVPATLFAT